jgi:hypothetical protein
VKWLRTRIGRPGQQHAERRDLGREAVERIAAVWQVDAARRVDVDGGFDWWPAQHRVSVRHTKANAEEHGEAWRVSVTTEFLTGANVASAECRKTLVMLGSMAPTYAWIFVPPDVNREYEIPIDGNVELRSSVTLRADTNDWLPEFLARVAILQPIHAQRMATSVAELVGGRSHVSGPGNAAPDAFVDDILGVDAAVFGPEGQAPSRWLECAEFAAVAETYGRSDTCWGNGDRSALALETPYGRASSRIRLHTDIVHPWLGNGLLSTVELPFTAAPDAIVDECAWLNFFESRFWTDFPQLGSWHPREHPNGESRSASAWFLPNALFAPGIATNAALWAVARARWVRQTLHPDLKDLPMNEILRERFDLSPDGRPVH